MSRRHDPLDDFGVSRGRVSDHEEGGMRLSILQKLKDSIGLFWAWPIVIGECEAAGTHEACRAAISLKPRDDTDSKVETGKNSGSEDDKQGFDHRVMAFKSHIDIGRSRHHKDRTNGS
jgi:hypothetical protein